MELAAITLGQDRAELSRLNDWLATLGQSQRIDASVLGDMKLCLNEAITNIIDYGRADGVPLRIVVELHADGADLTAVLDDNSFAFDPMQAPEALPITSLQSAQIGGFGISLMRSTSARMHYARIAGHNRLTIFCRPRA